MPLVLTFFGIRLCFCFALDNFKSFHLLWGNKRRKRTKFMVRFYKNIIHKKSSEQWKFCLHISYFPFYLFDKLSRFRQRFLVLYLARRQPCFDLIS